MREIFNKIFFEIRKIGRGIKNLRFFRFIDINRIFKAFNNKEKVGALTLAAIFIADILFIGGNFYFAHTTTVPAQGSTYIEGFIGQPRFLNPLLAQSQTDQDLTHLIFSGLYKFDDHGNFVPDLADGNINISSDQKTYTIKLKPNLKWHDGKPITADDVVYTIQTLQDPQYKSPLQPFWQNIKISKIDDLTIKLTNPDISSPFITNLTLGILPQHIWSKIAPENFIYSQYNIEPIGSGPYFVKEINKAPSGQINYITLNSYSNYWQGKPDISTFTAKFYTDYQSAIFALHSKNINGMGFIPFDQKIYVDTSKTNLQILKLPIQEYQAIFFNEGAGGSKVLQDQTVRSALAQSVDRQGLINDVYYGMAVPTYSPIMPQQLGYNPDVKKINAYDLSAANDLLQKSGWILDDKTGLRSKGNQPLQFTITTNDYVLNVKSAEDLQSQWKKVGADVKINIVKTVDLENNYIKPRSFEAILFSESTGFDPDPFVFWHSSQAKDPGYNISQYKDSNADRLISDARNTFDSAARADKYKQFQLLLANNVPAIFLDQSEFIYELARNVKGMQLTELANPQDRFYDIPHWYINTKRIWKK